MANQYDPEFLKMVGYNPEPKGRHIPIDVALAASGIVAETLAARVLVWWHYLDSEENKDWEYFALTPDEADELARQLKAEAAKARESPIH